MSVHLEPFSPQPPNTNSSKWSHNCESLRSHILSNTTFDFLQVEKRNSPQEKERLLNKNISKHELGLRPERRSDICYSSMSVCCHLLCTRLWWHNNRLEILLLYYVDQGIRKYLTRCTTYQNTQSEPLLRLLKNLQPTGAFESVVHTFLQDYDWKTIYWRLSMSGYSTPRIQSEPNFKVQ